MRKTIAIIIVSIIYTGLFGGIAWLLLEFLKAPPFVMYSLIALCGFAGFYIGFKYTKKPDEFLGEMAAETIFTLIFKGLGAVIFAIFK